MHNKKSKNKNLSRSAVIVQNTLNQQNLTIEVMELPASTRTAHDAAKTLNCNIAQIVKSLLFKTKNSNLPILILASGANRVNEKKIAQIVGQKIIKADADYVREITAFAIGGIPPIGHKQEISIIFIDEDLLQHESLWAAAGTPNAVFSLLSKNLSDLTNGKIISIK